MTAPGSGPGSSTLVWYAAFGSNLSAERFLTYLWGGPVPRAAGRVQAGARDRSAPRDDVTLDVPHRLYFARSSRTWSGGGVAFLDPLPAEATATPRPDGPRSDGVGPTRCRLWLITAEQFADVYAQENGLPRPPGLGRLLTDRPAGAHRAVGGPGAGRPPAGRVLDPDRWYGRVLSLGPGPGGHPVLTFTAPDGAGHRAAHRSYLLVVGTGLVERFDLTPDDAARYLAERDGNRGTVDPGPLAAELERLAADPPAPYRRPA